MRKIPLKLDRILFFFSPLFSLPFIIRGVFHKNKISLILFCLCIGFISFGFIPVDGNDKTYYIYLFDNYKKLSTDEFFDFLLSNNTDIFFYYLLYFINWIGLPFEFFSLTVTFITCYLIFIVFYELSIKNKARKDIWFMFFLTTLFAISIPDLLSGMRNYLSVSFAFYGFYLLVSKKENRKSILFILMSIITHYSALLYILVFVIFIFTNNKLMKYLFIVSLAFIFLPRRYLLDVTSSIGLPEVYRMKSAAYLSDYSYIDNNLATGNSNNLIRLIINGLWFYLAIIFSLINIKNNDRYFIFFLSMMIVINLISSASDLLVRYGLLANLIFLIVIFYGKNIKQKRLFVFLVLLINFLNFAISITSMSMTLITSLYKPEYLTLVNMFFIDATTTAGTK